MQFYTNGGTKMQNYFCFSVACQKKKCPRHPTVSCPRMAYHNCPDTYNKACTNPVHQVSTALKIFMIAPRTFCVFHWLFCISVSRVAQTVQCLAADWTTGRSRFDPRQRRKDFSRSFCVQTGSRAQRVQWVPEVLSPGVKRGRDVTLTSHPH
jgi:hypothetical protein